VRDDDSADAELDEIFQDVELSGPEGGVPPGDVVVACGSEGIPPPADVVEAVEPSLAEVEAAVAPAEAEEAVPAEVETAVAPAEAAEAVQPPLANPKKKAGKKVVKPRKGGGGGDDGDGGDEGGDAGDGDEDNGAGSAGGGGGDERVNGDEGVGEGAADEEDDGVAGDTMDDADAPLNILGAMYICDYCNRRFPMERVLGGCMLSLPTVCRTCVAT